jgi:bacterioferritin
VNELFPLKIGQTVQDQMENDLALEYAAVTRLNNAVKTAVEAGDNGSRELFEKILIDEERHIDWLEAQLHLIKEVGLDNYLAQQLHEKA